MKFSTTDSHQTFGVLFWTLTVSFALSLCGCSRSEPVSANQEVSKKQDSTSVDEIVELVKKARTFRTGKIASFENEAKIENQKVYFEWAMLEAMNRELRTSSTDLAGVQKKIAELKAYIASPEGSKSDYKDPRFNVGQRLAIALMVEKVLSDTDPNAKEKAIKAAEEKVIVLKARQEELSQSRNKKLEEMMAAMDREHPDFKDKFKVFFNQKGSGKFENFEIKEFHGSFSKNESFTMYADEQSKKLGISVSVVDPSLENIIGIEKKERLDDRFWIIGESRTSMSLVAGHVLVRVKSEFESDEGELREFFQNVVNQPNFDRLLKEFERSVDAPKK